MTRILTVNTWVGVRAGCSLAYQVQGNDIEFTVGGGGHEPVEIVFDTEMLREFLRLGARALDETTDASPPGGTQSNGDS